MARPKGRTVFEIFRIAHVSRLLSVVRRRKSARCGLLAAAAGDYAERAALPYRIIA